MYTTNTRKEVQVKLLLLRSWCRRTPKCQKVHEDVCEEVNETGTLGYERLDVNLIDGGKDECKTSVLRYGPSRRRDTWTKLRLGRVTTKGPVPSRLGGGTGKKEQQEAIFKLKLVEDEIGEFHVSDVNEIRSRFTSE